MKLSDKIAKLSTELEIALSSAAEVIETYTGDRLDDDILIESAEAARDIASDIGSNSDIDGVIGVLQSIQSCRM